MDLIIITPPIAEPLTLAEARAQLGLSTDEPADDGLITALVSAARQHAESYTNATIAACTRRLDVDSFGDVIALPKPRVQSVVELSYLDADGVRRVLDSASYKLDPTGYVVPAAGTTWPSTSPEIHAVRVDYVCGYGGTTPDDQRGAIPAPIKQWVRMQLATWWTNREGLVVGASVLELPRMAWMSLLDPYIVWGH